MTPISRRGVLATIAAGIAGSAAARPEESSQYVVEQGDRCIPITPLSNDQTVEAFYDYRTPNTSPSGDAYSSYGTTDLQRSDTSICFLYEGLEGLSLVVLHDELSENGNGGAVTFRLDFENPERGAWVIGDDDYDAPTNYDSFTPTAGGWRVDWTWAGGRSDGGVYRPLGDDFAVTIDPAFNEGAALYGDHYEGEITDWQVLSGDRSDPDRVSLALDRPITIRPGSCGEPTTTTTTEEDEDQSAEPISPDVEIVSGKVNPRSHGRLPVVVHSSEAFDATDLARGSIGVGPRGADPASPAKRIRTDEDGDGDTDLKLLFWMDTLDIGRGTERVRLTGETESGQEVEAWAEVEVVPGSDDESDDDERDDTDETETEEDDSAVEEDDPDEREVEEDEKREEDETEGSDDVDDDDWKDDGEDDDREKDGDDHLGRGNGNGRRKRGEKGNGRGREGGNGKGRGNGRGEDNGRGKGN